MNRTKIEWVKNPNGTQGYTWNPITGCLNGCSYCYALKLANTRLSDRYLANRNIIPGEEDFNSTYAASADPFYPRFWEDREWLSIRDSKPRGIFTCDMSDLFGIGIPRKWTERVLDQIRLCYHHRFYLLTKQPQNLIKFSPFPDNCWVGVSATDYNSFYRGAINYLPKIQAKVKYISFEPLLEGMGKHIGGWLNACMIDAGISWVIIGAQTKPTIMPKIEWVREIVEACDKAGVKVFLKDSLLSLMGGYPIPKQNMWAYKFDKGEFKLKQEMPLNQEGG